MWWWAENYFDEFIDRGALVALTMPRRAFRTM